MEKNYKLSKRLVKKGISFILVVAMLVGMIPISAVKVLAEEVEKVYEMIIEPSMVYEFVYGFYYGISPVKDVNGNWGAIDLTGKEIVPCEYRGVYPVNEDMILVADAELNWYMLYDDGEIMYSYGQHDFVGTEENQLLDGYENNKLLVTDDNENYYIDFEGNKIVHNDTEFKEYLYHNCGDLYGGKYYLGEKYNYDDFSYEYVLVETDTKIVVRTYEGYTEMWVSGNDDTNLIGKRQDGKYVKIDSGSMVEIKIYDKFKELWRSKYDSSILFGKTNDGYVMSTEDGEIIYNYGDTQIVELWSGYLKQSSNIIMYDGTILCENLECNVGSELIENKYFVAYKWDSSLEDNLYYLMDIEGNVVKDYGNYVIGYGNGCFIEKYDSYFLIGKYNDDEKIKAADFVCLGDVIFISLYDEEYNVLLDIDGNVTYTNLNYSKMLDWSDEFDRFNQLYLLYNTSEYMDTIKYYNYCRKDANILYKGELLFQNDEVEAVGRFDSVDGYLPIKKNGMWGVIKIIPNRKKYSDATLNEIGCRDEAEQTTTSEKITTAPEQTTVQKEKVTTKPEQSTSQKQIITNNSVNNIVVNVTEVSKEKQTTVKIKKSSKVTKFKVKKLKGKKVKLTWKKIKNAKGYLIQYATNKKFSKSKKKFTTKANLIIKKLKSKKIYYFRVKAYKLDGKKKVLSEKWSKVKKIKI